MLPEPTLPLTQAQPHGDASLSIGHIYPINVTCTGDFGKKQKSLKSGGLYA
jgi:hypothetical protein